jgi:hypothetical protein
VSDAARPAAFRGKTTLPRVELLYFASCPNYEGVRELIERTAAELGVETQIDLVEVSDAEAAVELRFLGSPTVRVDGRDVEPGAEARNDFSFSCRLYRTDRGVVEAPGRVWIRTALAAASRRYR